MGSNREGEKKEKKIWGKKEQKNVEGNPINIKTIVLCTRISLQTFVFIGSVQKLNYVKINIRFLNGGELFEIS